jgi:hypothetical protein
MVRITDKIPAVRMQAANMLTRLQDPTDAEDPITAVFFHTLEKVRIVLLCKHYLFGGSLPNRA